jgi:hypothetical protein
MGWGGITNGKLLALTHGLFDVFVTLDKNLEYQQNLRLLALGIVVVDVPDNKIASYRPIFPELFHAATLIAPGQVTRVTHPQSAGSILGT